MFTTEILRKAFKQVKKNKGSGGIDKVSISKYENNMKEYLKELERLLEQRKYRPLPLKRAYIPKSNGKKRPLGIPAVRDRIVQQAVLTTIQPTFEPIFSNSSYGFRPKRSAHNAVNKVQEHLNEGYEYIVEADIKDFFTTLHHARLMSKVKRHIKDKQIIQLLWTFLKSGIMEEGKIKQTISGTPQGGVISPILANIYLNDFDHKIDKAGLKLVRYADDFIILCKTVNQATSTMKMIRNMIKSLDLELSEDKTQITEYHKGFDFLGYHFHKYYGNYKWPTGKAIKAFKDKVRYKTRRQQPKNVKMVIETLNPIIRGWGNYFKLGNSKKLFRELDGWTRMRLRSFIEKKKWSSGNWKYPNDHFKCLGLVSLSQSQHQLRLSLPY